MSETNQNKKTKTMSNRRSVILTLLISIVFILLASVSASAVSVGTATGTIHYDGKLTVRAAASTSSKRVMTIQGGTKVTILEEQFVTKKSTAGKNIWYKIKYNGKVGYVRSNRVNKIKYAPVKGKLTAKSNYRYGAGTGMKKKGTFAKNKELTIVLKVRAKGSKKVWYKIKSGKKYYYIASTSVKLIETKKETKPASGSALGVSPYDGVDFETYLDAQGFPESYKGKLRELHKAHPKWVFVAKKVDIDFAAAVNKECADGVSLVHSSYPLSYRDTGANSYKASADMDEEPAAEPEADVTQTTENESAVTTDDSAPVDTAPDDVSEPAEPEASLDLPPEEIAESAEPAAEETEDAQEDDPADAPQGEGEPAEPVEETGEPERSEADPVTVHAAEEPSEAEVPEAVTETPEEGPSAPETPEPSENDTTDEPIQDSPAQADAAEPDSEPSAYEDSEGTEPSESSEESTESDAAASDSSVPVVKAQGTYIPKDGSSWFNASKKVVQYYMDPRNFLNEDRIYMFEDLGYHEYHKAATVQKVIAGTALAKDGYMPVWFVNSGKKHNISPISLAVRARSEVGGGSIACSGYKIDGVTYYNPFNIGAYSGSNPVMNGMRYAQKQGWDTKEKAIDGGAALLSDSYLKNNQNTLYFQRFNVANGLSKVATHQYMTNIMAPYTESYSTKTSYSAYGILDEQLVFIIPVYKNMPDKTSLPK